MNTQSLTYKDYHAERRFYSVVIASWWALVNIMVLNYLMIIRFMLFTIRDSTKDQSKYMSMFMHCLRNHAC